MVCVQASEFQHLQRKKTYQSFRMKNAKLYSWKIWLELRNALQMAKINLNLVIAHMIYITL